MSKRKSKTPLLIYVTLAVLCIVGTVALLLWLKSTDSIGIFYSEESLQTYILSYGVSAPLIFIAIQVLQVIISPIPGNITTVAGGALFGFWPSFLYSSFAIILGSIIAFALARGVGRPLVVYLIGKKTTDKYLTVLSTKGKIMLIAMFLMPFFPDDLICFVAGLSGISWGFFLLVIVLTRPWGLLFSALVGSNFLSFPIWGYALLFIGFSGIFYVTLKHADDIESFFIRHFYRLLHRTKH